MYGYQSFHCFIFRIVFKSEPSDLSDKIEGTVGLRRLPGREPEQPVQAIEFCWDRAAGLPCAILNPRIIVIIMRFLFFSNIIYYNMIYIIYIILFLLLCIIIIILLIILFLLTYGQMFSNLFFLFSFFGIIHHRNQYTGS